MPFSLLVSQSRNGHNILVSSSLDPFVSVSTIISIFSSFSSEMISFVFRERPCMFHVPIFIIRFLIFDCCILVFRPIQGILLRFLTHFVFSEYQVTWCFNLQPGEPGIWFWSFLLPDGLPSPRFSSPIRPECWRI